MQNTEIVSALLTFVLWRSILKMLGGQKWLSFFILRSKREPGECFPENKKSARWRKRFYK